jgi:hypothetical protein
VQEREPFTEEQEFQNKATSIQNKKMETKKEGKISKAKCSKPRKRIKISVIITRFINLQDFFLMMDFNAFLF